MSFIEQAARFTAKEIFSVLEAKNPSDLFCPTLVHLSPFDPCFLYAVVNYYSRA